MKLFDLIRCGGVLMAVALLTANARGENFVIQLDTVIGPGVPGPGAGNIDVSTATDVYTFQGTNGQVVFLEEISMSSAFAGWLYWDLKSPANVSLSAGYFQGTHEGRKVLPATGTYTLTVKVLSPAPSYVGDYSFRVRSVTPDQVFPIAIGALVSKNDPGPGAGNLDTAGAHDVYTFEATAGTLAFFERLSAAATFEGWLVWELKAPSGAVVFRSYFGSGTDGRKTLAETGTYTLRVMDSTTILTHVGDYAFRIRHIPPDQVFPIQIGQLVSNNVPAAGAGNIEFAGAYDHYTFQGSAGQNLFFDDMAAAASLGGWLKWDVRAPNGQLVFSEYMGGSPAGRKTLAATGTYTIQVYVASTDPELIGTYAFRINDLDDALIALPIGQVVTNGVPTQSAGNIEEAGNEDIYTFQAVAGQRILFQEYSVAAAFGGWLRWELRSPSSNQIFAAYITPGQTKAYKMPETGTYRLRVFTGAANPAYFGTYSFRTYCEVFAHPDRGALSPGSPLVIPKPKLICNDYWEVGDVVSVDLPSSATVQGGTVSSTDTSIVYSPQPGFMGTDQFTYRITGQFGDDDTNVVNVLVGPGADFHPTVVSLSRSGANAGKVCLLGAPGQSYNVEQSTNLLQWQSAGSLVAESDGSMVYIYNADQPHKFFRFLHP